LINTIEPRKKKEETVGKWKVHVLELENLPFDGTEMEEKCPRGLKGSKRGFSLPLMVVGR